MGKGGAQREESKRKGSGNKRVVPDTAIAV
jgi:hypothetical protein